MDGLPRTNTHPDPRFGSPRHHERRCTGRKAASPGLVLRGAVRVVAGLGTRGGWITGGELAPGAPGAGGGCAGRAGAAAAGAGPPLPLPPRPPGLSPPLGAAATHAGFAVL